MDRGHQGPHLCWVTKTVRQLAPQRLHLQRGKSLLLCCWESQIKMNLNCTSRTRGEWDRELSKVIVAYLPGHTPHYKPFCQLHETCRQRTWKQKSNTKDFYPLTIHTYQHYFSLNYQHFPSAEPRITETVIKSIKGWILFEDRILLCNSVGQMYHLPYEKKSHSWFGLGALG